MWQDQSASFDGKEAVAQSGLLLGRNQELRKACERGWRFLRLDGVLSELDSIPSLKENQKIALRAFFSLFPTGFGKIERVATHVSSKGGQRGNLSGPL